MQFNPYLNFDGDCAEAFAFYKDVFNGTVVHQSTFGDMPPDPDMPPLPAEAKHRVMHVHLQVGQQALMGSDTLPGACSGEPGGYSKPQGLWVSIGVGSMAEGQRVFDALAAGGWRPGDDALRRDVLVARLRHGHRPLRHAVDG